MCTRDAIAGVVSRSGDFSSNLTATMTYTAEGGVVHALHRKLLLWMGAVADRLPMMVLARLIGVPDCDVDRLAQWGTPALNCSTG